VDVAKHRSLSKFYSAMLATPAPKAGVRGPLNAAAIQRDASSALGNIASLRGYQEYLTQARSWKARAKNLTVGFEREVQTQAAGALTDTRALASAVLRITGHFKQSGELDRMLSSCTSAIRKSGPVHSADLLADLENEPSIRELLKAEGVTDDLWSALTTNLKNVKARMSVQNGKLAAELAIPGQDKPRNVALIPAATGMPTTLSALLQRGRFERLTEQFLRDDRSQFQLVTEPQRDLQMADVALAGSLLAVQAMAEHSRGLQDVGLAKYAGRGGLAIWAIGVLAAVLIGSLLVAKYCKNGDDENAGCIAGHILSFLGFLALIALIAVAAGVLFPAPGSTGTMTCAGGLYHDPDGTTTCIVNTRPP
jgi:hypothetical protein